MSTETKLVMINIENRKIGEISILDLHGRLVADTENTFWKHASSEVVEHGARKLLINFADISLCDSFGIGEVIKIHKSLENIGGKMVLCNLNDLIEKVFEITKVDTVLNIEKDEQAGLSAFLVPALNL